MPSNIRKDKRKKERRIKGDLQRQRRRSLTVEKLQTTGRVEW